MDIQELVARTRVTPYQAQAVGRIPTMVDHARYAVGEQDATREQFMLKVLKAHGLEHMAYKVLAAPDPASPPVLAQVRQSRWIGECECGGAEAVDPDHPEHGFFCFSCYNIPWSGQPRPIVYPHELHRRKIERLLLLRPGVLTRNWLPAETPDDIERENATHGVPTKVKV